MLQHESLIVDFNDSAAPFPADETVVGLFAAQVERTPEDEAVRLGDQCLSYRALDERANQLAARLRAFDVGPDQLVALYMEHSIEVVCAILGVLKAGAAYVPLDPATPRERLAGVLRDMADGCAGTVPVLVAQSHLASGVPSDLARIVTLDGDFAAIAEYPTARPACRAAPGNLAYVIYTSGSTGQPKGVMIEHRSLLNYIWWAHRVYAQGERLTWPLFSSLAFDLTVTSIFTPLVSGGRIVVHRAAPGMQATLILKVVEDGQADIVKLTPAHLAMIKDLDLAATRIRRLIVGGEDFKTELAREVTERFGRPVEIYNEYGPTEATVGCMIHRYDRSRDLGASVPIGRPAANTGIFVLDADLRPVATGVVGEMCIAGAGLARGYFNRPELTAAAFVTAEEPRGGPATGSAAERIRVYKTGDLARWSADGRMEFLGRSDHQVKVGGFRIELGEIEARLLKHPEVRDCVVTLVQADPAAPEATGVGRLAAYYVSERPLAAADLRAYLAEELPHYMLPVHFVRLGELPLTPNGKVDRKALPPPAPTEPQPAELRPRTETEAAIARIWAELLRLDDVGLDSDVFDLGAHSMLVIKAATRIRDAFGVEVPLEAFFEAATVAQLADKVCDLTGLPRADAGAAPASNGAEPRGPRTATERRLLAIWEHVLGSPVGVQDDFLALQGGRDLLDTMLHEVKISFGAFAEGLPIGTFLEEPTVEGLARILDGNAESTSSIVVCLQPRGSKRPLFLIHAGGGYVFFYRALAMRLAPDRPVYAVRAETEADGLGRPFDRSHSVEELAARYIEEIETVQPQGPYTLGGACVGGVIAFEMARQLRARGQTIAGPVLLFDAFVLNNPNAASTRPRSGPGAVATLGVRSLYRGLRSSSSRLAASMRWQVARARGLRPTQLERMERFVQVSLGLLHKYRPARYDGSLAIFSAEQGDDLEPLWTGLAGGGTARHAMPGAHLDMMEEPAVATTASLVRGHLD